MNRRELLEVYGAMARIRAFEESVADAHRRGRLPGLLHLSVGGEAVAVGVCGALSEPDRVYTGHRAHGHFLAAGEDPGAMMAELAGREPGLCRGRGGSMHLMGRRAVLATGVVGGTLPVAVGHALTLREGAVVVVFFGDGAVQTGVFHESLNLAALWRAPVLFVCENNGWAEFTAREEHTTVQDVVSYGPLHHLPIGNVDGGDVEEVRTAAHGLLTGIRSGHGPALLECRVTRLRPHYEGDLRQSGDDVDDPLDQLGSRLRGQGVADEDLARARHVAAAAARDALERGLAAPVADPAADPALVYARAPR